MPQMRFLQSSVNNLQYLSQISSQTEFYSFANFRCNVWTYLSRDIRCPLEESLGP